MQGKIVLSICRAGGLLDRHNAALRRSGCEVVVAHSVSEAVKLVAGRDVNLIIVGAAFTEEERIRIVHRVNPTGMVPMLVMRPHPLDDPGPVHPLNRAKSLLETAATLLEIHESTRLARRPASPRGLKPPF